jgi:glyoxylate reductase
VVGLYRSNESARVTGPFNAEIIELLPSTLKFICHNGAGYDNLDVDACTKKGQMPTQ